MGTSDLARLGCWTVANDCGCFRRRCCGRERVASPARCRNGRRRRNDAGAGDTGCRVGSSRMGIFVCGRASGAVSGVRSFARCRLPIAVLSLRLRGTGRPCGRPRAIDFPAPRGPQGVVMGSGKRAGMVPCGRYGCHCQCFATGAFTKRVGWGRNLSDDCPRGWTDPRIRHRFAPRPAGLAENGQRNWGSRFHWSQVKTLARHCGCSWYKRLIRRFQ